MKTSHRVPVVITQIVVLVVLGTACSTQAPKHTPFMKDVGVEDVTARELQLIVYAFAQQFEGTVELAAQKIQQNADSHKTREDAILWKLNAIPLAYQAAFNPDPLGALTSLWALCVQMRQYFTTGAGKDVFGQWQPVAVEASQELESDVIELAGSILPEGKVPEVKPNLEVFAERNPFENQLFVRTGDSPQFLKEIAGESPGGFAAAASMHDQMRTINDRTALLMSYVPRQVQWQSELLMAEVPKAVAVQKDSVIAIVQETSAEAMAPLMEFIASERENMTTYLSSERSAVLETIANERIAAFAELEHERIAVLEQIAKERNLTLEGLNALTMESIERMFAESRSFSTVAIDHAFARSIQLLALPVLIVLALCAVALFMIRGWVRRYLEIMETSQRGFHRHDDVS